MKSKQNLITRTSLSEQVYNHIKKMILSEELKLGEKVPEAKIAKIFGVSRTPIREALRKLEKSGLVNITPHSFAKVVKISEKDTQEIYEVRLFLEILTVSLLSKKATQQDYEELLEIALDCERYANIKDVANVFLKDSEFHLEIAERSGNDYLYKLLKNMDVKIQLIRTIKCTSKDKVSKDIKLHKPLIEAIYEQDQTKAVNLISKHIIGSYFFAENSLNIEDILCNITAASGHLE